MTIQERIFALIKERKYTQKKFATDTGISEKTIGTWKACKRNPPANLIPTIADYLSVSVDFLLTGKESVLDDKSLGQLLDLYRQLDDLEKSMILGKMAEIIYQKRDLNTSGCPDEKM